MILTLSIFFTDHGYDSSEIYANDQLVSAAKYQQNSPPTMPGSHNSRYIGTAKVRFFLKKELGTIHLRRRQIFMIFDPYPPTIGIPAKCL